MTRYVNEAKLADKLHAGDPNARTELFYGYFNRLYSFIFYSVGKEHNIAEDITRRTFIDAINSVRKHPVHNKVYTWLLGIANRKITDYYDQPQNMNISRKSNTTSDSDSPEPIINAECEKALYNLPFEHRQVILLRYIEEMPVYEISVILNRSPKSIETMLNEAQKSLKACHESSFSILR